ncbi:MAG: ParA family protein [Gammaproteobacteria bacterium]|nr:ParA family protein [Gammaproteobacteria bacterium]
MQVWTVCNQKGGVGKTTTTVALGGLLASHGERVLLVDFDPHASMTAYFAHDPDAVKRSGYELFHHPDGLPAGLLQELVVDTGFANLSLLPASISLATLDRQLGASEGVGTILNQALFAAREHYDFVLIDCPPILGVLMVNALAACQHLLIPVQTDFLALKGMERMLHTLDMVNATRGEVIPYTIVPTLYDRRTHASVQALHDLKKHYDAYMWDGVVPMDTKFRDASNLHMPPSLLAPSCRGVRAYKRLLKSMLDGSLRLRHAQAARRNDALVEGSPV